MTEPVYLFSESDFLLPAYWAVLALCLLIIALLIVHQSSKQGLQKRIIAVFFLLAVPLALLFGRLIFCLVRFDTIFFDEIGEYSGMGDCFYPEANGFSVIGVFLGALLSSILTSRIYKIKPNRLLDQVAAPAALLFALARLLEPLNGQGYGEIVEAPFPQFFPFSLVNEMGDRVLSISFLEALLALAVFLYLVIFRKRLDAPALKTVFFMVFFTLSQIIPESLRRDDVLFIFIFARVTHVGYMLFFTGTAVYIGWLRLKQCRKAGIIAFECALTLLGVAVCILCEFALDKTNYSKLMIYLVMASTLALMALFTWRRMLRVRKMV